MIKMVSELLKIRQKQKKRKPNFVRQETHKWIRLKKKPKWRRPKGLHSKMRHHLKGKGVMPDTGYGAPKEVRGLHPSGYEDILISNIKQLESLNSKKQAARIASKIGRKERVLILKRAEELGIKVLNP